MKIRMMLMNVNFYRIATAYLFSKEGAKIVVSDLDPAKAKRVADAIKQSGGQAIAGITNLLLNSLNTCSDW